MRTLRLDIGAVANVTGAVVERESRRALGGARVELIPEPAPGRSVQAVGSGDALMSTVSDSATGRFQLSGVATGSYRVRAALGPLMLSREVGIDVVASAAAPDVEIELDASGGIVGRIRAAPDAQFNGLRALVTPLAHELTPDGRVRDPVLRSRVAVAVTADGTFRSVPLPSGPARVALLMPEMTVPSGAGGTLSTGGSSIDLGVVDVEPGIWHAHEFDASTSFPGTVEVLARVDGRPAFGHVVELQADRGTHLHPKAGAVVTPSGRVTLGPIASGDYVVTLRTPDAGWVSSVQRVNVRPGAVLQVEATITVERDTLTLVDRNGRPTPHEEVRIRAVGSPPPSGAEFVTDDGGMLRLSLPPGRYSIARGLGSGIATRTEFAWPPGPELASGLLLPE